MTISKRVRAIREKVQPGKVYVAGAAIDLLKELSTVKFVETVEACINLGVDPRKSDQVVRGAAVLPNGTGKTVKVAVFAQGAKADAAKAAGADIVGFEDLAESIKAGEMNFDLVIASPDAMALVGKLGTILGPKGLMPNPKVGTVAADVAEAVRKAKAGQVQFRTDKNGIIHCTIGKINFSTEAIQQNLNTLLAELKRLKPASSKGIYIKKISIATTMGPGLVVEQSSINAG
jgi:large subunit ribosomal protein L1